MSTNSHWYGYRDSSWAGRKQGWLCLCVLIYLACHFLFVSGRQDDKLHEAIQEKLEVLQAEMAKFEQYLHKKELI